MLAQHPHRTHLPIAQCTLSASMEHILTNVLKHAVNKAVDTIAAEIKGATSSSGQQQHAG